MVQLHGGEALDEEGSCEGEDAVIGLVPRDEVFLVLPSFALGYARGLGHGVKHEGVGLVHGVRLHLAEAEEGMHLVEVAADLLVEGAEVGDVGVDLDFEEITVALEAKEDAVEEIPAVGRAVDGSGLSEVEKGLRGMGSGDRWAGGAVGPLPKDRERGSRERWRPGGRGRRACSPPAGRNGRGCASQRSRVEWRCASCLPVRCLRRGSDCKGSGADDEGHDEADEFIAIFGRMKDTRRVEEEDPEEKHEAQEQSRRVAGGHRKPMARAAARKPTPVK